MISSFLYRVLNRYNFIYLFLIIVAGVTGDFDKLPNCRENLPGLVLVSTLDGTVSALNPEARLLWQIDTGPGPLVKSNIHNLELTNNGQWIRIIPSLSGTLYKFDGQTIDQIPISADTLLKSSFKYSDDLVIAGGLEVRTYGVGFQKGTIYYACSLLNCKNETDGSGEPDDILIIERSTQTVRAIEPRTGSERWNFSVGVHNIKLHKVNCMDSTKETFTPNISTILPDGVVRISTITDERENVYEHTFSSPIVHIWKWNGIKLDEVDVFATNNLNTGSILPVAPAIYVGMHKKQLYISESNLIKNLVASKHGRDTAVVESDSLHKIPWKPVPASAVETYDDSTALSVLYASEYINGNGYYLYSENNDEDSSDPTCYNNTEEYKIINEEYLHPLDFFILMGRETLLILCFTFLFIFIMNTLTKTQNVVVHQVTVPSDKSILPLTNNEPVFTSRYLNDFNTLRCLGKGGFGIVFEVKQKIDECNYAIKRITLPNGETSRNRVLREVKALAKLDHQNIVRYFNSWVESPPFGWEAEHDKQWIKNDVEISTAPSPEETEETSTRRSHSVSVNIDIPDEELDSLFCDNIRNNDDSIEIVFENESGVQHSISNINCEETKSGNSTAYSQSNQFSYSVSEHVKNKSFWKRPKRQHHSWDLSCSISKRKIPKVSSVFLYIQMQLCQKESLREWLKTNHQRNLCDILNIFKQIISAVEYVHLQGLIHRDLKPSNIFFSLEGQIKVGDFGLVKDMEENFDLVADHTLSLFPNHTKNVGTYLYMSPEQLKSGHYNYKVDIYSLGLIFFELLVPFSTDMERISVLTNLRNNKYPSNFSDEYPKEYHLLKMMLNERPEKRLTTIGIKAKPPLNCADGKYGEECFYELPK